MHIIFESISNKNPEANVVIKNAKILDLTGQKIVKGDLKITGNRIAEIGHGLNDSEEIDGNELYLLYGMIDLHTYLGIAEDGVGFNEFDLNESSDIVTPQLQTSYAIHPEDLAIKEALSWGITHAVVLPGPSNVIAGTGAYIYTHGKNIQDLLIKEPCCMKVNLTQMPLYYHRKKKLKTRMYAYSILRKKLLEAQNYLTKPEKKQDKSRQDLVMLGKVLKKEIPFFVEVHRIADMERVLELKEEFGFDVVFTGCTEAHLAVDLLKEHAIPCILGPLMIAGKEHENRNTTFRTCRVLEENGITFSLSHSQSENPVKLLRFLAIYAHKAGTSEWEALRAITKNGFHILKDTERGNIEPGKIADIVAFDGHPLSWKTKVVWTMIGGKIVQRGEL